MAITMIVTSFVGLLSMPSVMPASFLECAASKVAAGTSAELPADALAAWKQFRDRARRLQGSVLIRNVAVNSAPELTHEWYHEFKQADKRSCLLYETRFDKNNEGDTKARLFVANPEYGFTLIRSAPERRWVLSGITNRNASEEIRPPGMLPHMSVEKWMTLPITFHSIFPTIEVSPGDPEVTISQVIQINNENVERVRVHFAYVPDPGQTRTPSISGWAEYDPAHYWVMTDCEVRLVLDAAGKRASVRGRYEYNIQADGFPILRKFVKSYWNETVDYRSEYTHDFSLSESVIPDEAFTLAAYGFPEADALQAEPRPAPRLWLWLALIGGACVLVAAVARWWVRRRAA